MDIREEKVYIFKFPYQQTDFTIPVRAETKEQAVDILQKWLSGVQTELAMEFPKVSSPTGIMPMPKGAVIAPMPPAIPPEVLEMRIDTLLGDLGAGQLKGNAKDDTIKLWTDLENKEENYTGIITELEKIQTGTKEVPVKQNGKKGQ